jgi:hypothetical protein
MRTVEKAQPEVVGAEGAQVARAVDQDREDQDVAVQSRLDLQADEVARVV